MGVDICHREGCERPSLIVIRVATDGGPSFSAFCRGHLGVASEFVAALGDEDTDDTHDPYGATEVAGRD